jgi:DNA-binding response OmpR family regulator
MDMIILVAEDEALIALVLELTLRPGGHRVLGPVATVAEALRLADETAPELALVDINLQDGDDGVALARTLRDRYGTPSLFLSGQVP